MIGFYIVFSTWREKAVKRGEKENPSKFDKKHNIIPICIRYYLFLPEAAIKPREVIIPFFCTMYCVLASSIRFVVFQPKGEKHIKNINKDKANNLKRKLERLSLC